MDEMLEAVQAILPEGWHIEDYDEIECPHGYVIELDGTYPKGCRSPVVELH
jgi:hypothetical protein